MGDDPQGGESTLLQAARSGDPGAFPALFERWFARTRDLTESVLSDGDDIRDAIVAGYRRAWETLQDIAPGSFGTAVGVAARGDALERLEAGAAAVVPATRTSWFRTRSGATAEDRLVACSVVDEAASDGDIADLVRAASLVLSPADRSLLVLHLRLGISEREIAAAIGDPVHDVEQRLFRLRARLRAAVEAIVLWRGGRPACDDLARVVRQVSKGRFDSETAAAVTDHAEACARCGQHKRLHITPAALFAAIPSAAADPQLHDEVTSSLTASGVPVIAPEPEPAATPDGASASEAAPAGVAAADTPKHPVGVRRVRVGALVGGAIVALALLLLGLQPWQSPGEPRLGTLGSSSSAPTSPRPTSHVTTTTRPQPRSTPSSFTTTSTTVATHLPPPGTNRTTTTTTTTSPTTRAPSTTRAPMAPAFVAASVGGGGACPDGRNTAVTLSWRVRDATSVAIRGPRTNATDEPLAGRLGVCLTALPASFTLTAHGPGGATSETLTVDSRLPSTTTSTTTTSTTPSTPNTPNATTGQSSTAPSTARPRRGH